MLKALALALVSVAGSLAQSELETLWQAWKLQHAKEYETPEHDQAKFEVFSNNYHRILSFNSEPGQTATLALNKFADLTNEEFGAIYTGYIPGIPADAEIIEIDTSITIPDEWDWRNQSAVTPIKDQGKSGSCWAFGSTASMESLYIINKKGTASNVNFAEQQIVDCDELCMGCNGGKAAFAMQYVSNHGQEPTTDYPYEAKTGKCQYSSSKAIQNITTGPAYLTAIGNPNALKTAIAGQVAVVAVEADQDAWQFYSSGVVSNGCGTALDHNVAVVGYGKAQGQDAFYIKNSWGADWGVNGYIYISTSPLINKGQGACGILTEPTYPKGKGQL
jgi:C1A family cysteine protease